MPINASNGFLILDGQTVTQATEVTWSSKNNGKLQKTLTGANGSVVGQKEVSLSVKCATPRTATERRRVYEKYATGAEVTMTYRTANGAMRATGIITETNLASRVDEGDEFDFTFIGFEEPYQQVG